MSLQRKENNLRRAQARLDRVQNPPRWKVISWTIVNKVDRKKVKKVLQIEWEIKGH